jgi:hypothetical protein
MDYGDPGIEWGEANEANADGQAVQDAERAAAEDDERDYVQEYQDDLAMGRIYEDGSPRDPDEPDWAALDLQEHEDQVHGGKACDYHDYLDHLLDPERWAAESAEPGLSPAQAASAYLAATNYLARNQ